MCEGAKMERVRKPRKWSLCPWRRTSKTATTAEIVRGRNRSLEQRSEDKEYELIFAAEFDVAQAPVHCQVKSPAWLMFLVFDNCPTLYCIA